MLRTSVLERLCAPLCDAVLGERTSAARSTTLARSNLFLVPLDDQRRWFRFHHLFAQILRVELERREPELVPRAAPPRVRMAPRVRHHRGGDPPRASRPARSREAGELIAETWVYYANAGRTTSVLEWLHALPRGACSPATARLLLVKAWISRCAAREDEMRAARRARPRARRARRGTAARRLRVAGVEPLRAARDVRVGRRRARSLEHGARSAELEGPESPWRPVVTWALGWAHYCNGDLDEAERWLRETRRARAGAPSSGSSASPRSPTCR